MNATRHDRERGQRRDRAGRARQVGERAEAAAARARPEHRRAAQPRACSRGRRDPRREPSDLVEANQRRLAAAEKQSLTAALLDRLRLDAERVEAMAAGRRRRSRPCPIPSAAPWRDGRGPTASHIARVSVPLGVIGIIYESRPNVTADAGGAVPARRQCGDPARRLGKLPFLGARSSPACAQALARGGTAGGCDPAGADPRPRARSASMLRPEPTASTSSCRAAGAG